MKEQAFDPNWEKIYSSREWGKYPYIEIVKFVARNFYNKDRENTKILDVGCGTGSHVWYLSKEGFQAFGIDGSKTAIQKGKERLESENLKGNLVVGDILELPYENNVFNGVLDNACLYANNEEHTKTILKEIQRVLKNKGLFYSRTFGIKQNLGKDFNKLNKYEFENITEGALAGNNFARLVDENKIKELYGKFFKIKSIDIINHTENNGNSEVFEFQIICENSKGK